MKTGERTEKSGLTATTRAQQKKQLPGLHIQIELIQGNQVAKALDQPPSLYRYHRLSKSQIQASFGLMQVKMQPPDTLRLDELEVWIDEGARSPHEQMAIDEACFDLTRIDHLPRVRFYRWAAPALTIGYFDSYPLEEARPIVRRITGGGLVEHGADMTFCLTLPTGVPATQTSTSNRYHWINCSLGKALLTQGIETRLEESSPGTSGPCFAAPVQWDLLDSRGEKIAGGAQRNSRGNVIHQGSVQKGSDAAILKGEWISPFSDLLAKQSHPPTRETIDEIIDRSRETLHQKYEKDSWNRNGKLP